MTPASVTSWCLWGIGFFFVATLVVGAVREAWRRAKAEVAWQRFLRDSERQEVSRLAAREMLRQNEERAAEGVEL